uniref:BLOC-1-related complex subunit 5 n=1 Tax=Angiostrongylus cantonensis TaxID=6313 RepID=A0A158P972_ANGCA
MDVLETLRETIVSVQNEISSGVERLRFSVAPSSAAEKKCVTDAVDEIVKTTAGSDMLLKYQLSLDQMSIVADEGARLANLCSTRMGRAQQMCKERADAIMAIDSFLRNITEMEKKIRDLNKQVDKLTRFCNQTEQAMTYLEALCQIVRTEEEMDLLRQQSRSVATIINMDPSPALVLNTSVRPSDEVREQQEEVMLEEFLSGKIPASFQ